MVYDFVLRVDVEPVDQVAIRPVDAVGEVTWEGHGDARGGSRRWTGTGLGVVSAGRECYWDPTFSYASFYIRDERTRRVVVIRRSTELNVDAGEIGAGRSRGGEEVPE